MRKFYSDSTKGFYIEGVHKNIPVDAVSLTDDEYREAAQNQTKDTELTRGPNGKPVNRNIVKGREEIEKALLVVVRNIIDKESRDRGFSNIIEAVSYADEPTEPKRQALGSALREWRSSCMVVYDETINSSDRLPNKQQLIASLPNFVAP